MTVIYPHNVTGHTAGGLMAQIEAEIATMSFDEMVSALHVSVATTGDDIQENIETECQHNDEAAARAEKALEARARRAAKRAGYRAVKSRARNFCVDNQLGFQILDSYSGYPAYGWNYELTAQDVIDWCESDDE